jgi:hypothetical protein
MAGQAGKTKTNWEVIGKLLSGALAIGTLIVGLIQYDNQNVRAYRQKLYEERLQLYSNLVDLSSRLTVAPLDSLEAESYRSISREFDFLFYGRLNMVKDTTVERAMNEFKEMKNLFEKGAPEVTPEVYRDYSVKLGRACRISLQQTQAITSL